MKWAALLFFILVAVGLAHALRTDRRAAPVAAFVLGFLPFVMTPWHLIIAPYAIPAWPGYVKGWEVGLIDAIAMACLVGTPRARFRLPFKFAFLLYIVATVLSVYLAPNPKIALSYTIQLARIFLVFAAVARLSSSPSGLKAILQGLFIGLSFQALMAILARLDGAIQTGGSFGHQNLLGFVSHLVFIPAFGLLLSGLWRRWAIIGLISGAVVIALTVSRATIAFAAMGLIVTFLLSATSRWSARKAGVGLASLALIGLAFPFIHYSFERRFETQGSSGFAAPDEERHAFEVAAKTMIADHPFGVGANHYVVVANTQGYNDRAGVIWATGSRATNVHNSFLLIQAETGYFGLFAVILLLGTAVVSSLVQAFRGRRYAQADVLIGIVGGLSAMILHSFYEWMLVTYQAQYFLAVSLGMAAGTIRQLKSAAYKVRNANVAEGGIRKIRLSPRETPSVSASP